MLVVLRPMLRGDGPSDASAAAAGAAAADVATGASACLIERGERGPTPVLLLCVAFHVGKKVKCLGKRWPRVRVVVR